MITSKQAKESRLKLALSQNFIAKEAGLSRPYLSNFEAGSYKPNNDFLETLKAFFEKHGVKFDNAQPNEIQQEKSYKGETRIIKPIDGIVPNIDYMAYEEAKNIMQDINKLNGDLLKLSEEPLPTKDTGIFFENNIIDTEKVASSIDTVIYRMAKAYLDIMNITGNNTINAIYNKDLLPLTELSTSDECSINDYVVSILNNCNDDIIETSN